MAVPLRRPRTPCPERKACPSKLTWHPAPPLHHALQNQDPVPSLPARHLLILYKARYNSRDCPCSGQAPYCFPVLRPESRVGVPRLRCRFLEPAPPLWAGHRNCEAQGQAFRDRGCRLDLTPRTTSPRALLSGRRPYPGSTQTGSGSDLIIARRSFMQRQTPNQHLSIAKGCRSASVNCPYPISNERPDMPTAGDCWAESRPRRPYLLVPSLL